MKILGLVTARGGSKRVPRKNIKNFLGKPLLAWTIEVGLASNVFDRFVLTTDDKKIAEIGRQYGIEVPFMRPAELAQDTSSSFEAIKHAVVWLKNNENWQADWIILLEPPAPGRQAFHIQEVAEIIKTKKGFDSVVGISEMPAHFSPFKALVFKNGNEIVSFEGKLLRDLIHRNQDVPKTYFINSAIYAFKTSNLFASESSLWGDKTYGYIMDSKYAFNIDTPEDWLIAEAKMKELIKEIKK